MPAGASLGMASAKCCKGDFDVFEAVAVERAGLAIIGGNYPSSYESEEACADYHPENPQPLVRYFVRL